MNTSDEIEKRIREAFNTLQGQQAPPPAYLMKARSLVNKNQVTDRPDIITMIAAFLNLKVKLVHVVIVFILFWLGYLAYQTKDSPRQEASTTLYNSDLAATTNNTVLPCIQTFILKK